MESQRHGLDLEDKIKNCGAYGEPGAQGYTDAWDISAGKSAWSEGLPVQIKAVKKGSGSVMLGDAQRNFKRDEPFELLALIHTQADAKNKELTNAVRMSFTPQGWRSLMGDLSQQDLDAFCDQIKAVPKGSQPQAIAEVKRRKAELKAKASAVVDIQAKIDSKSQRRCQMSAPLECLMAAAERCETLAPGACLGSIALPYRFESAARARSKKPGRGACADDSVAKEALGLGVAHREPEESNPASKERE